MKKHYSWQPPKTLFMAPHKIFQSFWNFTKASTNMNLRIRKTFKPISKGFQKSIHQTNIIPELLDLITRVYTFESYHKGVTHDDPPNDPNGLIHRIPSFLSSYLQWSKSPLLSYMLSVQFYTNACMTIHALIHQNRSTSL